MMLSKVRIMMVQKQAMLTKRRPLELPPVVCDVGSVKVGTNRGFSASCARHSPAEEGGEQTHPVQLVREKIQKADR